MHVLVHDWELGPPLVPVVLAAVLYARGMRERGRRRTASRAQAWWFAAGLALLAVALVSPLAAYDDSLFWAHMAQHVLLLAVVPPLLLMGRPGTTSWRAFPLGVRRAAARSLAKARWAAPLRVVVRLALVPAVALALFVATMAAWHIPALYDATLRSTPVHYLEHALFLGVGLLFWSRLVDSPPAWSRLTMLARASYATVAMVACWMLAIVLALATSPLYSYADAASLPGGISPLADQRLAAGIMWVPGSLPFVVAAVIFGYRWLGDENDARRPARVEVAR